MTRPVKIVAPLARELAEAAATEVGACIRPLAVRRIDTQTGARATIPISCGSTKASKCPPCADRARRLQMWQAHEGWHLDTDPKIVTAEPTAEQLAVIGYRADLEAARAAAIAEDDTESVADLERAIVDADDMLRAAGARGTSRSPGEHKPRRVRSTRRRQDAPNLPRLPVADRTTGRTFEAPDGRRTYLPSTFLTLTLPSYGRMYADGSPVDPAGYDYRRAARDAIHFGDLVDRLWQNLRRATGWNVQYFAAVEPQRRGAPHLHAAVRGTIPRKLLRQVAAATYHQVWWPAHDEPVYSPGPDAGVGRDPRRTRLRRPRHRPAAAHLGPGPRRDRRRRQLRAGARGPVRHPGRHSRRPRRHRTGRPVPALPREVQYLTKVPRRVPRAGQLVRDRARRPARRRAPVRAVLANLRQLAALRRRTPQREASLVPGLCKGKAHKRENLGYGGRRCLVSRKWSGWVPSW